MFKSERQEKIIKLLKERDYASVQLLCSLLFASEPTIRRDLTALEREGLIRRSHGGAMLVRDEISRPLAFRQETMQAEKRKIAQKAAELIPQGAVLFIDGSTTAFHLIPHLAGKEVTVITNGLATLNFLQEQKIKAKCIGGDLLHSSMCFVGRSAEQFISDIHADLLFFSVSCLNHLGEITDYSEEETYLRKALMKQARKRILLMDHSKFSKTATFHLCTLQEIDGIITDLPKIPTCPDSCQWIKV